MKREKIGIMGGTFDPIHNGHLLLAECAANQFNLDKILFIPTGISPHKNHKDVTSNHHRYNMVLLAINSNYKFFLSTVEMDRQTTTYTVDTIEILKSKYKNADLYFILGSDSLLQIHNWKDYKRLLSMCNFIVAKRPGEQNNILKKIIDEFKLLYNSSILILEGTFLDISSSQIRERVKKGIPISNLVPKPVEIYIHKHKLYL